jgi:hypothetical protein
MKNNLLMAGRMKTVVWFSFATVLMCEAVQAQKQPSNRPRTDPPPSVMDVGIRDMQVRSLELSKDNNGEIKSSVSPEIVKQVKEDFGRIQEINAEVMKAYTSGAPPDYKYLAEAMADINKRAGRLKTNLLLPEPESTEAFQEQNGSPLVQLNSLIVGFVTNPIFKNANTIDAQDGVKAKRDLGYIVELSNRIRKSAERLDRASGKPK